MGDKEKHICELCELICSKDESSEDCIYYKLQSQLATEQAKVERLEGALCKQCSTNKGSDVCSFWRTTEICIIDKALKGGE